MKKINWRVRLRSGPFLAGSAGALLTFVYALCNLIEVELPVEQGAVLGVVMLGLGVLSTIGIITDPTTPGVEDSDRAMSYDEPGHIEE